MAPREASRRVLIYGGSFDPPHLGHVMATTWALALGRFDEIRLVPALGHPFGKKRLTDFALRCAMVRAAVAHLGERVRVDPIEGALPPPSYTVDTVRALSEREPDVAWTLMMGADSWVSRRQWREWDELERRVDFVVIGRAGSPDPEGVSVETKLPNVSSTEIRRRVAADEPIDTMVCAEVAVMVREHGLYSGGSGSGRGSGGESGSGSGGEGGSGGGSGSESWRIGVLGRGRAAMSIVPVLEAAGVEIGWWWSLGDAGEPGALGAVDAVILAVPDGEIEAAAGSLGERASASEEIWLHLSGSRPGGAARVSPEIPRAAGCLHPLVALTGRPDAAHLRGATAGIDGDDDARDLATTLAGALGLRPRRLTPGTKALYHAAAVTAAGHTVALFSHATALLEACGFSAADAREALHPLARGALDNLTDAAPAEAITGPIARGDVQTILAHLAALDTLDDTRARTAYLVLARRALELSAPTLPEGTVADLRFLLAE